MICTSFRVGESEDIAKAIHSIAQASGPRGVECTIGSIRVGADVRTPVAAICADVNRRILARA